MEENLTGSYSELGSDDELLIYQQSDNDSAGSDLSAIKTYSLEDYGDEYLQGYSTNTSANNDPKIAMLSPRSDVPDHLSKFVSEGQRVFLPLALTSDVKLNWTQRFVQISTSLRKKQPFYAMARDLIKLAALEREFLHIATVYARIIIDEKYLPTDQKTIKPSNIGGVAGGLKYYKEGILFKFALDNAGLYGGDINSMKSAGHELKCLGAVFRRLKDKYNVPMMSVIDYKGFRVIAISLLPVGSQTLIYGSNNGGRNFHAQDPDVNDEMDDLGKTLNLQSHQVRADGYRTHLPADIEIHKGLDDRYYIVDVARLWPPEPPSLKGSWLYRAFREEFVTNWNSPLCSDGFSVFLGKDPSARSFSADIRVAFTHYTVVTVPLVAHELNGMLIEDVDFDITSFLHSRGVNMRHMGLVWQYLSLNSRWHKIVLTEIVARAAKSALRALMRRALDRFGVHTNSKSLNGLICGYFNLLLGSSEDSDLYWAVELKQTVESSFFYISKDEVKLKDVDLKNEVDQEVLLRKLSRALGITFKQSFWNGLPIQLMLNRGNVVQSDDIESIEPVVKRSYISRFAEPIEMIERLDCGVKDEKESEKGYRTALQKLMETPSIGHGSSFVTFRSICRILARLNGFTEAKIVLPYLVKLTHGIWTILESSPLDYHFNLKQFLRDFGGLYLRYVMPLYEKFNRDPEYVSLLQQLVHPYFLGIMLSTDTELLAGRSVLSEEIFDEITSVVLTKQRTNWMYQQLLPRLKNLKRLDLGSALMRSDAIVSLIKHCSLLETLEADPEILFGTECEDMLASFSNLRELYNINLDQLHLNNSLAAKDLTKFSANLRHSVRNLPELCNWLATKNSLRSLRLNGLVVTNELVPTLIESVRHIEELCLGPGSKIDPLNTLLQGLSNLTSLTIMGTSFSSQVVSCEGPFKLKKLVMQTVTSSSDVLIGILQRSPELVELNAMASEFDDKCCETLNNCPNLQVVNLSITKITGVSLAYIAPMQNIRRLSLKSTAITDQSVLGLEKILPQLTDLNVSRCANISNLSIRFILKYGRSLKKLKLSWNAKITDQAFEAEEYAASQLLLHLTLEEASITDAGMRVIIQQYPHLEVLHLPRSVGVDTLKNLHRLQHLRLVRWLRSSFDWTSDPSRIGITAWGLMLNKAGETKSVVLQLINAKTDSSSTVVVGYAGGAYLYLDNVPMSALKTVLKFVTYNNV